jgi:small subunit ribosomal protein S13
MLYILETKLLDNSGIFYALKNVYGIGKTRSLDICRKLGFSKNLKIKNLSEFQIKKIVFIVENSNILITSDLKKLKSLAIKTLVAIKSYRGLRKIKGLPVRGQRTHTNAKTSRKFSNQIIH